MRSGNEAEASSFRECVLNDHHLSGSQDLPVNKIDKNIIELHMLLESKRP